MNKVLEDLERITDFSKGSYDPRPQLMVCQGCPLRGSSYSVSFYNKILHSLSKTPIIMFISRDPNIKDTEIKDAGSIFNTVKRWKPRKHGVGWFFSDFLVDNGLWKEFLNYLENESIVPRFYWTHLIKCHAQNNKEKVDSAIPYCAKYLEEEIKEIKPQLIICAGIDVIKTIINNFNLNIFDTEKIFVEEFRDLIHYHKTILDKKKGIIGIYHPSGKLYQLWKKGKLYNGITFEELRQLINDTILNFDSG